MSHNPVLKLNVSFLIKAIVDRIRIYYYRFAGIRFVERKIQRFRMLLDVNDKGISTQLLKYEIREPDNKYLIEKELKKGMRVLDCGANIGYYTNMMGKIIGDKGKIFAYEPDTFNFLLLQINLVLNNLCSRVACENYAISDRVGNQTFYRSTHSNLHTFLPTTDCETPFEESTVAVTTLAEVFQKHGEFDFLRMDIEGFETIVLKDLEALIVQKNFFPTVLFESHASKYSNKNDIKTPLEKLFDVGYCPTYVVANISEGGREFFEKFGYTAKNVEQEFLINCKRAIYTGIKSADAIEMVATRYVRAVLLQRKNK